MNDLIQLDLLERIKDILLNEKEYLEENGLDEMESLLFNGEPYVSYSDFDWLMEMEVDTLELIKYLTPKFEVEHDTTYEHLVEALVRDVFDDLWWKLYDEEDSVYIALRNVNNYTKKLLGEEQEE